MQLQHKPLEQEDDHCDDRYASDKLGKEVVWVVAVFEAEAGRVAELDVACARAREVCRRGKG